jgi:hypothetical protein
VPTSERKLLEQYETPVWKPRVLSVACGGNLRMAWG